MLNFRAANVIVVSALFCSTSAWGTTNVNVCASGRNLNECQQGNLTTAPDGVSIVKNSDGAGSGVLAVAFADYGTNKAYAYASSVVPDGPSNLGVFTTTSSATSSWNDQLKISTDLNGYMLANLYLNALHSITTATNTSFYNVGTNYSFGTTGSTQYSLLFLNTSGGGTQLFESFYNGLSLKTSGDIVNGQFVSVKIPFTANAFFNVNSNLSCQARTSSGAAGSSNDALCNAGNSAHWAGISGVFDNQGNPITSWTLSSQSGTDYTRSFVPFASGVPEPSTWFMMLLGFGFVGYALRKSKRHPKNLRSALAL